MNIRFARTVALLFAAALFLGACATKAKAKATTLAVEGSEYKFGGLPASVAAGVVTINFKNTGTQDHMAVIVKIDAGHTVDDAVESFKKSGDSGPTPDWIHGGGGSLAIKPGQSVSVTQNLGAGTRALFCFVSGEGENAPEHYKLGMFAGFTVTEGKAGDLPKAAATVVAREYSFDVPALSAGRTVLRARNDGPKQFHIFELLEFPAGVTLDQTKKITADFVAGKEPKGPEPDDRGGFGVLDPGGSGTFEVTLTSGRSYVFICFLSDRAGGPPHFTKGMATPFAVA